MSDPSDPTNERPGMTDPEEPATLAGAHPGTPRESEAEETDGQVSEVGGFNTDPISDGDSVQGTPTSGEGQVDPGAVGPEGVPPENRRDNDFEPRHRKPDEGVDDL